MISLLTSLCQLALWHRKMATSLENPSILRADSTLSLVHPASLQLTPRLDQRMHRRYPIELDAEFELLNKGRVELFGSARTLNISTGGVLLSIDHCLPTDGLIRLAMNWPFLLDGVCLLRLVVRGRIVWSDGGRIAVQAKHREFRTAGVSRSSPNRARR
jgi:hypothetical protein